MTDDDMVERVARAIIDSISGDWTYGGAIGPDEYLGYARAAIAAMRTLSEAQLIAGAEWACTETRALGCWQAMIDAALKETTE